MNDFFDVVRPEDGHILNVSGKVFRSQLEARGYRRARFNHDEHKKHLEIETVVETEKPTIKKAK